MRLIFVLCVLCGTQPTWASTESSGHGAGEQEEPFHEILDFLNVTDASGFTEDRLTEVVAAYVDRFPCYEDGTVGSCDHHFVSNS